jgi:acetylornithine deacetylase
VEESLEYLKTAVLGYDIEGAARWAKQAHDLVRQTMIEAAESDPWLREHQPEVEFFGVGAETAITERSSPLIRLMQTCHQRVSGGPLNLHAFTGSTDQRFFVNQGRMDAIAYRPAGENLHAAEERVSIASIKQTAEALALFILNWCGVAGQQGIEEQEV